MSLARADAFRSTIASLRLPQPEAFARQSPDVLPAWADMEGMRKPPLREAGAVCVDD